MNHIFFTLKNLLQSLWFPESNFFGILYRLSIAVRVWMLTIIFPLMITLIAILIWILTGDVLNVSTVWFDFYIFGEFCGFKAWRIHLAILFILSLYWLTCDE